jgi:cell division protein FtsQ
MKKIIMISLWSIFTVGIVLLMSFAGKEHSKRICTKPNIVIEQKDAQQFLKEEDILKLLADHNKMPEGKEMSTIDIPSLEKLILTHPAVESAEVYMTIGGEVNIHIKQRRVIARIMNLANESYYIDDRGMLMPWSEEYTAPVILVNGFFADSYGAMYNQSLDKVNADTAIKTSTVLDDIWQVTKRIDADTFLHAQMIQLYVSPDKGLELIPRIGNHVIVLGDISDLDEKFKKLMIFYHDGLERTGNWNDYSYIDLQYKNQIVCTKKTIEHGI